MRTASALAATAAATLGLLVASAGTASADDPDEYGGSAIVTIGNLEAAGYTVNVDRVGSAPLEDCIVTDVRNPQEVTRTVRVDNGHGDWDDDDDDDEGGLRFTNHHDEYVEVVVSRTISVSLDCSG